MVSSDWSRANDTTPERARKSGPRGLPLIPASDAQKFARQLPNSIVRIYDGVGHIPMEEQPKRSADDIRAFLKGTLTPAR